MDAMHAISSATRALAEDPNAYGPVPVGCERIVTPRYVIWLSARPGVPFTVVQRLRFHEDEVEEVVAEIRGVLRDRGRSESSWEVGSSATPSDLVDRLRALGMSPFEEPRVVGMVLTGNLPAGSGIDPRRVASLEEYVEARRIQAIAFGQTGHQGSAELLAREWEEEQAGAGRATYLAWLDGTPVAAGAAKFTPAGVVLNGAGTLPQARGHGAFRALVEARWRDGLARGVPAVVVQAGAMSRPILERLGFVAVCDVAILVDG